MQAAALARPGGTVVSACCTEVDGLIPIIASTKEVRLQFASAYYLKDFHEIVDVIDSGAVKPRCMVTDTLPLEVLPATFESLRQGSHQCKRHIDPWA